MSSRRTATAGNDVRVAVPRCRSGGASAAQDLRRAVNVTPVRRLMPGSGHPLIAPERRIRIPFPVRSARQPMAQSRFDPPFRRSAGRGVPVRVPTVFDPETATGR